jgi:hypothetical protein
MPALPKLNEIPVFLKDEGRGKVSFVFEDDRSEDFPYDVTLYLKNNDNDTEIAIGTATTLSENVFYFEDEDDNDNTGNYLYDADRHPIGFVKNLTNSFYIKQSDLVGGAKPPTEHPGQVGINNLDVGNEYEFVIQSPIDTEQRTYRGRLISKTNGTLRITDYTISNGVRQDGIRSFPLAWVRRATILQPVGGGKKKKAKKTKKAKKSKKAKKTQRKSIRSRRRRR